MPSWPCELRVKSGWFVDELVLTDYPQKIKVRVGRRDSSGSEIRLFRIFDELAFHQFDVLRSRFSRSSISFFFNALRSALLSLLSSELESAGEPSASGKAIFCESGETAAVSPGVTRFKTGWALPCGGSMATQVSPDSSSSDFFIAFVGIGHIALDARRGILLPRNRRRAGRLLSLLCQAFFAAFAAFFLATRLGKAPSASRIT